MPRIVRTLVAAVAALAMAAPVAFAMPTREPIRTSSLAGTTASPRQDLRSPDAQDAARAQTQSDVTAAIAQERYYSSYGDPEPVTAPASVTAADTSDGIAPLPFVLGLVSALIVGVAAGTGMHQLVVRRRHAAGLPA
jgi:hypothetical protein